MDGALGGLDVALGPGRAAYADQRLAGLGHDLAHVLEVHVDGAGTGDHVGNTLDGLAQHVVRAAVGVVAGSVAVHHRKDPVVGDHQQAVGMRAQLLDAGLRLLGAGRALEAEGAGDHADHQRVGIGLLGGLGHHGRGAGAGPPAHAGGDKEQVRVGHRFLYKLVGFQRGFLAPGGVAADPQALGEVLADLDAVGGLAAAEVLRVGVHRHELHQAHVGFDHAVDGVAAASADADDLDHGFAVVEIVIVAYSVFGHRELGAAGGIELRRRASA